MKKILIIGFSLIPIVIGAIIIYELKVGKKVTNAQISERSKIFIKSQKQDTLLEKDKTIIPHNVDESECFTFVIPWTVTATREDGPCDWHYVTEKPKVNLNIYVRPVSYTQLSDEPGIRLRREKTTVYKESKIKNNGREYIVFHKKTGTYEVNAFNLLGDSLFVINILSYGSQNLDRELETLLGSIKLKQ